MSEYCKLILSLSLSGTILALVLFVIKPLVKNKVSKAFLYYIWLVVLIRLICPVSLENSVMNQIFQPFSSQTFVENSPNKNGAQDFQGNLVLSHNERQESLNGQSSSATNTQAESPVSTIAFYIWFAGAAILLLRKIIGYRFFISRVERQQYAASDEEVAVLSESTSKPIALKHSSYIQVPMLVGLFKPTIVLPGNKYSVKQLNSIFAHELCHLDRQDILYKWFTAFVACLHWFNPIMPLISAEINRYCELACDEKVISSLNLSEKQYYGETLIYMAYKGSCKGDKTLVSLFTEKRNIKERLESIMKHPKKTKSTVILMGIVAAMVIALSVTLGVAAINNPPLHSGNGADVTAAQSGSDNSSLVSSTVSAPTKSEAGAAASQAESTGASAQSSAAGNAPAAVSSQVSNGFCSPLDGAMNISAMYGTITAGHKHTGLDFFKSLNSTVYAAASGTVTLAGYDEEFGKYIEIKHTIDGKTLYSYYACLNAITVTVGQKVNAKQAIGAVGSTGQSTGPHLHFEIRTNSGAGHDVDPLPYLTN